MILVVTPVQSKIISSSNQIIAGNTFTLLDIKGVADLNPEYGHGEQKMCALRGKKTCVERKKNVHGENKNVHGETVKIIDIVNILICARGTIEVFKSVVI